MTQAAEMMENYNDAKFRGHMEEANAFWQQYMKLKREERENELRCVLPESQRSSETVSEG